MPKTKVSHPSKERVRDYMDRRTHAEDDDPPPTPQEVRDQLGWHVVSDWDMQDGIEE